MTTAPLAGARLRGVAALAEREVLRVLRLWTQTIAPPVVAAVLLIVVFGVALGASIRLIDGVPYERFIVPGLVLMGVATVFHFASKFSLTPGVSFGPVSNPELERQKYETMRLARRCARAVMAHA